MVATPFDTPPINPVGSTEAIKLFELLHVPPGIAFAYGVVAFAHTLFEPVIAGTTGIALTVIAIGAEVAVHPFASVKVYE